MVCYAMLWGSFDMNVKEQGKMKGYMAFYVASLNGKFNSHLHFVLNVRA